MTARNETAHLTGLMNISAHTHISNLIAASDTPEQAAEQILQALCVPQDAQLEFVPLLIRVITILSQRYCDVVDIVASHYPLSTEHQDQLAKIKDIISSINFQYLATTLT